MKIEIDIPEDMYKVISEDKYGVHQGRIYDIIRNGTPLPKGHGRLIDADKLWDAYHDLDYDFYDALDFAQTIIEAESEDNE